MGEEWKRVLTSYQYPIHGHVHPIHKQSCSQSPCQSPRSTPTAPFSLWHGSGTTCQEVWMAFTQLVKSNKCIAGGWQWCFPQASAWTRLRLSLISLLPAPIPVFLWSANFRNAMEKQQTSNYSTNLNCDTAWHQNLSLQAQVDTAQVLHNYPTNPGSFISSIRLQKPSFPLPPSSAVAWVSNWLMAWFFRLKHSGELGKGENKWK